MMQIGVIGLSASEVKSLQKSLHAAGARHLRLVHDALPPADPERPRSARYAAILVALSRAEAQGLDLMSQVRQSLPQTPLIVLVNEEDVSLGLEALRQGAKDCLIRAQIDGGLFTRAVEYAVASARQEAQLKTSEVQFRKVIAQNADGILLVDQQGIVQFANFAAEALFGRTAEQMVGTPFGFPVVVGNTAELDILRRNGKPTVAEMRVVQTEWAGDKVYLASLRDITERRIAERQRQELLLEKQRAQALREFLSPTLHDFRTPFTTVALSLHRLRRVCETEQQLELLAGLEAKIGRLEQLLLGMLSLSQLDLETEFVYDRLELVGMLRGILATLAANGPSQNQVIEFHTSKTASFVVADRDKLTQAIVNVIGNAIRYTPDGSEIDVKLHQRADEVIIQVADNGIGISAEDLPYIFDRFYCADPSRNEQIGGPGLGLAITKKIVGRHGGTVAVESTLGKGTVVTITLPTGG